MISKKEIHCAICSHCDSLRASIVILGDGLVRARVGYFIMCANKVGCGCIVIKCALDALPIAIVDKGGAVECTLRQLGGGRD